MVRFLFVISILLLVGGLSLFLVFKPALPREESLVFEATPKLPILESEHAPVVAVEKPPEPVKEEVRPFSPEPILYTVPFTSQAPTAEWGKEIFQDACEEASVLMLSYWQKGKTFTVATAKDEIVAMALWQKKKIGHAVDTDTADTEKLLLAQYLEMRESKLVYDFTLPELITALARGPIIVPTNGQKLGNPNFTRPGPIQHMLVIIGYDPLKKEFITNDPGTRNGKSYRYAEAVLFAAIRDYPTGKHLPIKAERKAMIIVPEVMKP